MSGESLHSAGGKGARAGAAHRQAGVGRSPGDSFCYLPGSIAVGIITDFGTRRT